MSNKLFILVILILIIVTIQYSIYKCSRMHPLVKPESKESGFPSIYVDTSQVILISQEWYFDKVTCTTLVLKAGHKICVAGTTEEVYKKLLE